MPPPKHSRATVPAPYVLTLVEGLAALKVPDRPTDRRTEGGKEMMRREEKKRVVGTLDFEGKDERWSHMRGGEAARGQVRYIQRVLKGRRMEQGSNQGWGKAT